MGIVLIEKRDQWSKAGQCHGGLLWSVCMPGALAGFQPVQIRTVVFTSGA